VWSQWVWDVLAKVLCLSKHLTAGRDVQDHTNLTAEDAGGGRDTELKSETRDTKDVFDERWDFIPARQLCY